MQIVQGNGQPTVGSVGVVSLRGKAKSSRKPAKRSKGMTAGQANRARWLMTSAMGVGIPLASLALASIGGHQFAAGRDTMGGAFLGLCVGVLAVSLSHVAEAIRDIAKGPAWQSWVLAVIIDAGLVGCEVVGGFEAHWVAGTYMVTVTLASMALNCWAFHNHKS